MLTRATYGSGLIGALALALLTAWPSAGFAQRGNDDLDGDGVPNADDRCHGHDDGDDRDGDGIPDNCEVCDLVENGGFESSTLGSHRNNSESLYDIDDLPGWEGVSPRTYIARSGGTVDDPDTGEQYPLLEREGDYVFMTRNGEIYTHVPTIAGERYRVELAVRNLAGQSQVLSRREFGTFVGQFATDQNWAIQSRSWPAEGPRTQLRIFSTEHSDDYSDSLLVDDVSVIGPHPDCSDSDADGVVDLFDRCPGSDDALDADGDGEPDGCDGCPQVAGDSGFDDDGDGIPTLCDVCPMHADHGGDGDADGTPDACDACDGGDDALDADGDGVPDACDVCDGADDRWDSDGDGVPDGCDRCFGHDDGDDRDGDGIPDNCEVCNLVENGGFESSRPGSHTDTSESLFRIVDLPGWSRFQGSAIARSGGAVDAPDGNTYPLLEYEGAYSFLLVDDMVRTGIPTVEGEEYTVELVVRALTDQEPAPIRLQFGDQEAIIGHQPVDWSDPGDVGEVRRQWWADTGAYTDLRFVAGDHDYWSSQLIDDVRVTGPHPDCSDTDGDGVVDLFDQCPGSDDALDADGDGVPDACDACPQVAGDHRSDNDGDGIPDDCDVCPMHADHSGGDGDADGTPDVCDACGGRDDALDADGDGTPDGCDVCDGGDDAVDGDGDGVPDACDICPAHDDGQDGNGDGIADGCAPDLAAACYSEARGRFFPAGASAQLAGSCRWQYCWDGIWWLDYSRPAGAVRFAHPACEVPEEPADTGCWSNTLGQRVDEWTSVQTTGTSCGASCMWSMCRNAVWFCEGALPSGVTQHPHAACEGVVREPVGCDTAVLDRQAAHGERVQRSGQYCANAQTCNMMVCDDGRWVCDGPTPGPGDVLDPVCEGVEPCFGPDSDGDGVLDSCDACAGHDDRVDSDADGTPDACDECPADPAGRWDGDGDGVCDASEFCPDGDSDGDDICDADDICPGAHDREAPDRDGDRLPDLCDACPDDAPNDSDGDGVCDGVDLCPWADDREDLNADGTPDGCEPCELLANGGFESPAIGGAAFRPVKQGCGMYATLDALQPCHLPLSIPIYRGVPGYSELPGWYQKTVGHRSHFGSMGGQLGYLVSDPVGDGDVVRSGRQAFLLDRTERYVSMTIGTIPGTTYELSFAALAGGAEDDIRDWDLQVRKGMYDYVDGDTRLDVPPPGEWGTIVHRFEANAPTTWLTIWSQARYPITIDDVSVVGVSRACVDDADADGVLDTRDLCAGFDDGLDTDGDGIPDGCDACEGHDDWYDADADGKPDACDQRPEVFDGVDVDDDGLPDGCPTQTDLDGDGFADQCEVCDIALNGGFERPRVLTAGVTPVPEGSLVSQVGDDDDCRVGEGHQALVLDGGGLNWELATEPGTEYELRFQMSHSPGEFFSPVVRVNFWPAHWLNYYGHRVSEGFSPFPLDPEDRGVCGAWTTHTVRFVPDAESTRLRLVGEGSPSIDAIRIVGLDPSGRCADLDGDGVPGTQDQCEGDDTVDADEDGQPDDCDVCPFHAGEDAEGDGSDTDEDGRPDSCDACPGYPDFEDADGDRVPDGCDVCDGGDDAVDGDGDGVPDACDICPAHDDGQDGNGDGIADGCAPDLAAACYSEGCGSAMADVGR